MIKIDILNKSFSFYKFNFKRKFSKFNYLSFDNLDIDYYLKNLDKLVKNINLRRSKSLIKLVNSVYNNEDKFTNWIKSNIHLLPNFLHEKWENLDIEDAKKCNKDDFVLKEYGSKPIFNFKAKTAEEQFLKLKYLYLGHSDNLGNLAGNRCYMMIDDLCDLKNALIDFSLNKLVKKYNFNLVTVPNLVYRETINGCGFNLFDERDLIYSLKGKNSNSVINKIKENSFDNNDVCLSGTSEIPLAALYLGEVFDKSNLPLKLCTVSRCYRKEISPLKLENGIYRVHYFDKIEMFALTSKDDSENMLNEFLKIQKNIFRELELPFKIIDMPPHELGSSAHRKFDIECWFPGRKTYGEISSASNCTDFQSRRFNIKYKYLNLNYTTNEIFNYDFVHTVNGTACAIPRMLIAIAENHQTKDSIRIPENLKPFLNREKIFQKHFNIFDKKNKSN